MQDLIPGQSIAQRFKLTRRLEPEPGCECWLADDETREAPAVLRFPARQAGASVSAQVRREFARISQLVHPGVIPCLGLFDHAGRVACAHAHIDGTDLRDGSAGGYREALTRLMPALSALAYLHDLGMAHGGIDARSIRVTADGKAFLDRTGVALLLAPADRLPGIREDLRDLGSLLALLAGVASGAPIPEELAELFATLQSPAADVPDIHAVRRKIIRILRLDDVPEPRALMAAGASAGPIAVRARAPGNDGAAEKPRASRRASVPMLIAGPALLAALALAVVVIFFLPQPSPPAVAGDEGGMRRTGQVNQGTASSSAETGMAPFAAAETARIRQDAQDAAMSLLRSLVALDERHTDVWAADEYSAARLAGEEGDALYRRQEFGAALARYREGLALAETLIARSGEVLSEALQAGAAALQAGDADEASRQFELAALIDGENPDAQAGLTRATALTEVLRLMATGSEQEKSDQLQLARDSFREARDMDPQFAPAAEALARVSAKLTGQRYQQLMSRGFARLNQGDAAEARAAFEQAAKMRPDASGPRDALAQLGIKVRNSEISDRRATAEAAEREEQWRRAESEYQAALEADSTLVFARDGLARARQRARLEDGMALLIREPLRMFSNDAYNEARAMLAQARSISDPGPRLKEQISALAGQVALAREPVVVELRSDGQTEVTIFKVGQLGRFQARTVGLIPGRYTAVGARAGYRDVRREFVVEAGSVGLALSVVCEDPI